MAEKYGMKLVFKKTFADFFTENITDRDNKALISRMSALEVITLIIVYIPSRITERLLSGRKESNQTNKQINSLKSTCNDSS